MKVIKSGKVKEPKMKRLTCDGCGCVFEFNPLTETRMDYTDPREGPAMVVRCPECNRDNWIAV